MKEQKLISMVEFVKEQRNTIIIEELAIIRNYANFLSQPLTLGMFVPCDENGEVLEEPKYGMNGYDHKYKQYQQAKERVLFEGFDSFQAEEICKRFSRVELIAKGIITLTKNAIKTIYG